APRTSPLPVRRRHRYAPCPRISLARNSLLSIVVLPSPGVDDRRCPDATVAMAMCPMHRFDPSHQLSSWPVGIDQVEAFVPIVRPGGSPRAATALHPSQPAVSRRLELLEREVGQPLFDRARAGARLTEAGRTFLPHAEALLASMRDGVEAVQALNRADRGTVTLALVGTLASTTLTTRLRKFRQTHPHV